MPDTHRPGRETAWAALRRFAVAITVLNLLGHTVLGFEQSWAHPLVALATAYLTEVLLEAVDARAGPPPAPLARRLRHAHRLPAVRPHHRPGRRDAAVRQRAAVVIAFAAAVAIASKAAVPAPAAQGGTALLQPVELGITATLLLFPWVGIAPPYQFTENLDGVGDWVLPALIVCTGTFLNWRFTHRLPLIAAWLGGFVAQAVVRHLAFGAPLAAAWLPMTGVAFILFTFYMVTDPATTPSAPRAQVAFGASVAAAYAAADGGARRLRAVLRPVHRLRGARGVGLGARAPWPMPVRMRPARAGAGPGGLSRAARADALLAEREP